MVSGHKATGDRRGGAQVKKISCFYMKQPAKDFHIICAIIISFTHHVCHTTSTDQNQSLPSFPNGFYFKKDNNLSFPQSKEVTTQEN